MSSLGNRTSKIIWIPLCWCAKARGSKLQGTFDRKAGGKIKESAHALYVLPETAQRPKVYAKRDISIATKEQKEKIMKPDQEKMKREKNGRQMRRQVRSQSNARSPKKKKHKPHA